MFGNPVLGPRIVPFAQPRLSTDQLPNGHPAFRVTQRFNDWDAIFNTKHHGALDLGNFHCGDALLAMADGFCIPLEDPNGAMGQEVQHDNGYRTQIWHMSRRVNLIGERVKRGRTIGYVGKTGLNTAGCHAHVVVLNPKGQEVDPWPLLDQNRPKPPASIVPWKAIMYVYGEPYNIREGIGGRVIGRAPTGSNHTSSAIHTKGPIYTDPRTGKKRTDWVAIGGNRSIAKSGLKTRRML